MKGARWAAPGTETLYSLWSSFAAHWSQRQASNWPVFWLLGQAFTGRAAAVQTPSRSLPRAPPRESLGPSTGAGSAWNPAQKTAAAERRWVLTKLVIRVSFSKGFPWSFCCLWHLWCVFLTSALCQAQEQRHDTMKAMKNRQHLISPWGEPCSAAAQDSLVTTVLWDGTRFPNSFLSLYLGLGLWGFFSILLLKTRTWLT